MTSDLEVEIADHAISPSFHFNAQDGHRLFTIKPDGSIERGPAFTTNEDASLRFWECVEAVGFKRSDKPSVE